MIVFATDSISPQAVSISLAVLLILIWQFSKHSLIVLRRRVLSSRPNTYTRAIEDIAKKETSESMEVLADALAKHTSPEARYLIVGALAKTRSPIANRSLVKALADSDSKVRFLAIDSLPAQAQARAPEELIQLLEHSDASMRRRVAECLGQICDAQTCTALSKSVKDVDRDVRHAAAKALGKIGKPEGCAALIDALGDRDDSMLRAIASESLTIVADASACRALINALSDSDVSVRINALKTVGKLGCAKPDDVVKLVGDPSQAISSQTLNILAKAKWTPRNQVEVGLMMQAFRSMVDKSWRVHIVQTLAAADISFAFGALVNLLREKSSDFGAMPKAEVNSLISDVILP